MADFAVLIVLKWAPSLVNQQESLPSVLQKAETDRDSFDHTSYVLHFWNAELYCR